MKTALFRQPIVKKTHPSPLFMRTPCKPQAQAPCQDHFTAVAPKNQSLTTLWNRGDDTKKTGQMSKFFPAAVRGRHFTVTRLHVDRSPSALVGIPGLRRHLSRLNTRPHPDSLQVCPAKLCARGTKIARMTKIS